MRCRVLAGALLYLLTWGLAAGWAVSLSSGPGSLPTVSCPDVGGNHLNFTGGVWTCGASSSGGAPGNAFADGVTKGIATFDASHFFDNGSGLIGLNSTQNNLSFANGNIYLARDDRFTLQDDGNTTRQARFQLSDITPGQLRVFTFPDFNATFATLAGTETLTGKTLSGGTNTFTNIPETALALSDVTTRNATTAAHGFLPKLPGGTTTFLRGDGAFAVPPGGSPGLNCPDTGGQHLNFTLAGGYTCGTSSSGGGGGGTGGGSFSDITSGTNTNQSLLVGNSSTLGPTGTGVVIANALVGLSDLSVLLTATNAKIVENKQLVARVTPLTIGVPAANQIQPNCDTTDIATLDAIPADLLVANPLCTGSNPRPEQEIEFRFRSSTPRLITWDTGYCEENSYKFLTSTTGDGVTYDRIKFRRNTLSGCWGVIANTRGVLRGTVSTSGTAPSFNCNAQGFSTCRYTMTGASGTLTVTVSGTVSDGTLTRLSFKCNNTQTFNWGTGFLASPNIALPTTCPATALGVGWFEVGVSYSQADGKHQVLAVN